MPEKGDVPVDEKAVIERVDHALATGAALRVPVVYEDVDATKGVLYNLTPKGQSKIDEKPTFTPYYLGNVFFGRSSHWVRWRQKEGHLGPEDHLSGEKRTYTLRDVQRIAFDLHERGMIPLDRLVSTLRIVREVARLHKYVP